MPKSKLIQQAKILRKVFFSTSVAILAVFLGMQYASVFAQYLSDATYVAVNVVKNSQAEFPIVTLCPKSQMDNVTEVKVEVFVIYER